MRVLNMLIPISVSVYIKTKTCVIHKDTSLGMTKRYTFYYIPFTEHMDPADIRGHHLNNWFTYVVTLENVYTLLCYQATAQCIPLLFCSVFVLFSSDQFCSVLFCSVSVLFCSVLYLFCICSVLYLFCSVLYLFDLYYTVSMTMYNTLNSCLI